MVAGEVIIGSRNLMIIFRTSQHPVHASVFREPDAFSFPVVIPIHPLVVSCLQIFDKGEPVTKPVASLYDAAMVASRILLDQLLHYVIKKVEASPWDGIPSDILQPAIQPRRGTVHMTMKMHGTVALVLPKGDREVTHDDELIVVVRPHDISGGLEA